MVRLSRTTDAGLGRSLLLAVALTAFVNVSLPAQEPSATPQKAEAFRQFLRIDMVKLGQLINWRDDIGKLLDNGAENTEKYAYYLKLVAALDQQIDKATRQGRKTAADLQQLQADFSVFEYAAVLRLREWDGHSTEVPIQTGLSHCAPTLRTQLADGMIRKVREVAVTGSLAEQTSLCQLLGEEARCERVSQEADHFTPDTLKALMPVLVTLSRRTTPNERSLRQVAALALALLQAPSEDQVAVFQLILEVDGNDLDSRRAAYRVLSLPFAAAVPRTQAGNAVFLNASDTDQTYRAETTGLLDQHAGRVVPLFAAGLSDPDDAIRGLSMQAWKDISSLVLVALEPAPASNQVPVPYDRRVKASKDIQRLQQLLGEFSRQTPALLQAASTSEQTLRLQAVSIIKDFAEIQSRLDAWQNLADPRATGDISLVVYASDESRPVTERLTPALQQSLAVLKHDLAQPDAATRLAALEVLEAMHQAATPALDDVVVALQDADPFVRWTALRIFTHLGPVEPAKVVPGLIPLIRGDQDGDMAKLLAGLLARYGSQAAPAVPALLAVLQSATAAPETRIASLQTLSALGPAAKDAIPTIAQLLEPLDAHATPQAPHHPAAFVSTEAVRYEDLRIRLAAAAALSHFGELARDVEPVLRAALNDTNPELRQVIGEALFQIRGN